MADKIRGITVELNGDTSGITKSLKTANTEIKSTQSQLKDVEKLLKLDPTNVELLRQKQKLLNDAVAESNTKLKTLHEAEKNLKDAGVDENSEQFMALKREIIATESAVQSYGQEAKDATKNAASNNKDVIASTKEMATAWAAVAAAVVAAGKAIADIVIDTAASADEFLTLSVQTGISTEKLQELQYASELVDVSLDTLTSAMTKNTRSMNTAQEGTGDAADAYKKLNIAIKNADGTLRDDEEVFWELIDALGEVENETERDTLAMTLLGRSAQDLNPLIEAGSDKLAELAAEAHEVGYVMNEETLSAFGSLDDGIQRLKNEATALGIAFSEAMLPMVETAVEKGSQIITEFTETVKASEGDVGKALVGTVDQIAEYMPVILESVLTLTESIMDSLVEALPSLAPKLAEAISDLLSSLTEPKIMSKLAKTLVEVVWNLVKSLFTVDLSSLIPSGDDVKSAFSWITDWIPFLADGGTVTAGGAAIVGEAGPELLTNVGGQAVVTPLTSTGTAAVVAGAEGGTITNAITIEFNGNLAQLAQCLQPYISAESHRIGV